MVSFPSAFLKCLLVTLLKNVWIPLDIKRAFSKDIYFLMLSNKYRIYARILFKVRVTVGNRTVMRWHGFFDLVSENTFWIFSDIVSSGRNINNHFSSKSFSVWIKRACIRMQGNLNTSGHVQVSIYAGRLARKCHYNGKLSGGLINIAANDIAPPSIIHTDMKINQFDLKRASYSNLCIFFILQTLPSS